MSHDTAFALHTIDFFLLCDMMASPTLITSEKCGLSLQVCVDVDLEVDAVHVVAFYYHMINRANLRVLQFFTCTFSTGRTFMGSYAKITINEWHFYLAVAD